LVLDGGSLGVGDGFADSLAIGGYISRGGKTGADST
jgi:hypothetical protein